MDSEPAPGRQQLRGAAHGHHLATKLKVKGRTRRICKGQKPSRVCGTTGARPARSDRRYDVTDRLKGTPACHAAVSRERSQWTSAQLRYLTHITIPLGNNGASSSMQVGAQFHEPAMRGLSSPSTPAGLNRNAFFPPSWRGGVVRKKGGGLKPAPAFPKLSLSKLSFRLLRQLE